MACRSDKNQPHRGTHGVAWQRGVAAHRHLVELGDILHPGAEELEHLEQAEQVVDPAKRVVLAWCLLLVAT
jgi:hypothetical protein